MLYTGDLEITGVHPRPEIEFVQVKEEPLDPDCPDQTVPTLVPMAAGEVEEDDDDVIFVDKETTMKYITGS